MIEPISFSDPLKVSKYGLEGKMISIINPVEDTYSLFDKGIGVVFLHNGDNLKGLMIKDYLLAPHMKAMFQNGNILFDRRYAIFMAEPTGMINFESRVDSTYAQQNLRETLISAVMKSDIGLDTNILKIDIDISKIPSVTGTEFDEVFSAIFSEYNKSYIKVNKKEIEYRMNATERIFRDHWFNPNTKIGRLRRKNGHSSTAYIGDSILKRNPKDQSDLKKMWGVPVIEIIDPPNYLS